MIGNDCVLYHGVTIGNDGLIDIAPKIGDSAILGAYSMIIGNVEIGDNCIIGANAIVTKSYGNNSILVGNPAKLIKEIK